MQRILHTAESISTWVGKAFAWLIVALMLLVVVEVFKRYALNMPTAWVFDASNMLYGTLFMMAGAYALAHDAHVRGDFLYGRFKPRTQAALDLVLYVVFFLPGIAALTWSGWTYFRESWAIHETTFNATPLPIYPFKFMIPLAGALVLMQGLSEMLRCVLCLRTGVWAERLKDAEEIDVVEQQLASSEHVDDEARRQAIERAKSIDDDARQRSAGGTS
ncbi:MAG: TRAP transporter small permease subunit [Proteobacteria bacterium]|nr:TRAP transporter small permease subunit [Pseudomonadota bacterium]